MIAPNMHVRTFVTHEGQMIRNVNGYNLTAEQIVELDSKNELTSWGVREYAKRYEEEPKGSCQFQFYCPECDESKPASMNRHWLEKALDNGREVEILSVCAHTRKLSIEETQTLRRALNLGRV